jgi:hypothetical protein
VSVLQGLLKGELKQSPTLSPSAGQILTTLSRLVQVITARRYQTYFGNIIFQPYNLLSGLASVSSVLPGDLQESALEAKIHIYHKPASTFGLFITFNSLQLYIWNKASSK